ncbi:MAG TPA: META domain-containing protein [Roseiflexaceae bacterium]|nr:META domain-containing protein [Roseiflexaceae bacterium]HMP43014.1 META domain-containing protein [Roseiflexaceae bacterium]
MPKSIIVIVGSVLLLASCGGAMSEGPPASGSDPAAAILHDTLWQLESLGSAEGMQTAIPGSEVTAIVTPGAEPQISGNAGCNTYSARVMQQGEAISFEAAVSTKRYCTTAGVMEQEEAFFRLLESVRRYTIEGDRLRLQDAGGVTVLTFRARL